VSVTIYDIAKKSGVSTSTVSRVLSGKITPNGKSYAKVMDAVKILNYPYKDPSPSHSLYKRHVMVIVDDILNPFYMEIASMINQILGDANYHVAIYLSDTEHNTDEELLRLAEKESFSGVIMITAIETPSFVQLLKNYTIPLVFVNRIIRSLDLNSVCIDNERGGYMATQYLIEKGHKKIAHLAGPANSTASSDRLKGYKEALEDANIPFSENNIFYGDLKSQSGRTFAQHFIRENFLSQYTAVFCANDIMAASFLDELKKHEIHVPDDLSIICFDDTSATTSGEVKLTTVAQSPRILGEATAEILLKLIDSKHPICQKAVFPPALKERDSVKKL
jgi:LacI family transcriptional regulator